MRGTLADLLIEAHRAEKPRGAKGGRAERPLLRPDHVVLEGEEAALALLFFESLGRERFACEGSLVAAEDALLGRLPAEDLARVERVARAGGAAFSRTGNGPGHQVYLARFAAPGRLVFGTSPRIAVAGALGALALPVSPIEAAAALAGAALERPWPATVPVRLHGKPPAWLTGEDVALELQRRWAMKPPPGDLLEFQVLEADALPLPDRAAIALRSPDLGMVAALFPSDEIARRFLRAQSREADWKPLPAVTGESAGLDLDFSDMEPLVALSSSVVLRLAELRDAPLRRIWIGPEASALDLARLAGHLAGRRVAEGVECVVTPASRQLLETAAERGWTGVLRAAGCRFGADPWRGPSSPRAGAAMAIACGVLPAALPAGWHRAGIESCAAAALSGAVTDPRALPAPDAQSEIEVYAAQDRLIARPWPAAQAAKGAPARTPGRGLHGPLRGTVLLALGDRVGADVLLPWGARVRPLALRIEALTRYLFAGLDPGFAERARAEGGGFLVAGREFGFGPMRGQVPAVAAAVGIRCVLARSYDAEFRRQLRQHGILALRFATASDAGSLETGDELEIPDLPEGLEPGKPLVVRNLSRGSQHTLHHDLDESGVAEVQAGGLLEWLRAAGENAGVGAVRS